MSAQDGNPWISADGKTVHAELWYPRSEGRPISVQVDLVDVRAADSIVIRYDFERDGWVIHQDRVVEQDWGMAVVEEEVEVAFVPAWNESAGAARTSADVGPIQGLAGSIAPKRG